MSRPSIRLLPALCAALALVLSVHLPAQNSSPKNREIIYEFHKAGENGITAPKAISMPQPEYTDQARRKKINGTVLLSLVVAADGSVSDPVVTRSLDKGLDKQALETVKTWKFQPATRDGQPVAVRIDVEVSFRIR
jgi:TonB family protein